MKSCTIPQSEQPRWNTRVKGRRLCASIYFDPADFERLLKMAVRRNCTLSVLVNEIVKKEIAK